MASGGFCPACLWSAGVLPGDSEEVTAGGHMILEEIGHGGMAVVYRALQPDSGREVALKVMRSGAHPELAARFRLEIGVLASLEHIGILPLYDSGEHEGRPWYSMKLAEGGTLADQMERYRGNFRGIAALVSSLSRTVHHAHGHGVLHRDLKPANILFSSQEQACVADFGLARLIDGERGLTLSAHLLGSPDYLSPEAAGSRPATVRTDVWGLGGILYTLLCGRPPHAGEDLASVIRSALDAEPPAPSARLKAGWPRPPADLETICRKAMAREPARRYAGADALAQDLNAWLEGRPVQARPVRWAERVWLWAKRRPAAAAAAVLVVATLAGAVWTRLESRKRIAASLGESRQLLAWMTSDLHERLEPLGQLAILEEADRRAAAYFDGIPQADHTAEFLLVRSEFLARRATLLTALGRPKEAVDAAAESLADAQRADGAPAALAAARALRIRAMALRISGDIPGSLTACTEARRALTLNGPDTARESAEISAETGDALASSGNPDAALKEFDRARSILEGLNDSSPQVRRRLWQIHFSRANQLLTLGMQAEALEAAAQARVILTALIAESPAQFRLAGELGTVLNVEGNILLRLGRREDAAAAWRSQREQLATAAAADSRNPLWLHEQAMNAWALATIPEGTAANEEIRTAAELFTRLSAAAPDQTAWLRSRVQFLRYAADHWNRREDTASLKGAIETGLSAADNLAAAMPDDLDAALWKEEFQEKQGGLLVKEGKTEAALDFCRDLAANTCAGTTAALLSGSLGAQKVSEWHLSRGESALAAASASQCLQWRMKLLSAHPGTLEIHTRAAWAAKLTAECAGPDAAGALRQHFLPGRDAGQCLPPWLRAAAHLCRATTDPAQRQSIAAAAVELLLPPGSDPGKEGARHAAELRSHAGQR